MNINYSYRQLRELRRITDPNKSSIHRVVFGPEPEDEELTQEELEEEAEYEKRRQEEIKKINKRRKDELEKTRKRIEKQYGVKLKRIRKHRVITDSNRKAVDILREQEEHRKAAEIKKREKYPLIVETHEVVEDCCSYSDYRGGECWIDVTDEFKSDTGIDTFDKVAVKVYKDRLDDGSSFNFNYFDGEIRLYTCGKCIEISGSEWLNFIVE